MKHFTSSGFRLRYRGLPKDVRALADKSFSLLKTGPHHPSLHFKKIGKYRSIRIGLNYRALATETSDGLLWFWIGNHAEYDRMIR